MCEMVDDDPICRTHKCDDCPNSEKCFDINEDIKDDYDTMTLDDFVDKYII